MSQAKHCSVCVTTVLQLCDVAVMHVWHGAKTTSLKYLLLRTQGSCQTHSQYTAEVICKVLFVPMVGNVLCPLFQDWCRITVDFNFKWACLSALLSFSLLECRQYWSKAISTLVQVFWLQVRVMWMQYCSAISPNVAEVADFITLIKAIASITRCWNKVGWQSGQDSHILL